MHVSSTVLKYTLGKSWLSQWKREIIGACVTGDCTPPYKEKEIILNKILLTDRNEKEICAVMIWIIAVMIRDKMQ